MTNIIGSFEVSITRPQALNLWGQAIPNASYLASYADGNYSASATGETVDEAGRHLVDLLVNLRAANDDVGLVAAEREG